MAGFKQGSLFGEEKIYDANKFSETYLFFDTETTGLPRDWKAPVSDLDNWPRLIQLAWVVYKNGVKIESNDLIIKPENFEIPAEASAIHGITNERAQKEGVLLQKALSEFDSLISQADYLVGHNISFDEMIVGAEFLRKKMQNSLSDKKKICTKEMSTDFCAIPSTKGYNRYKWPKLSELYVKLFGSDFEDSHNARADVEATAKCFWEMKRRGI